MTFVWNGEEGCCEWIRCSCRREAAAKERREEEGWKEYAVVGVVSNSSAAARLHATIINRPVVVDVVFVVDMVQFQTF